MGKGDRKTRRGKITKGTFGVRRPHKKKKPARVPSKKKTVKATPKKAVKKTSVRKKKEE